MLDRLYLGYRKMWRELPGGMTFAHYFGGGFVVVLILLHIKPLWGLGALLFWLVSAAGLAWVCVEWDLGRH